jgi:hypothetical protein
MKRRIACLLAVALASAAGSGAAATQETRAREAVETYTHALETQDRDARLAAFRRAEHLFADIAATGARSPELYTNLGNAALLSEDLGNAVLAYRRALLLDPDHGRALQNLAHVRSLLPGWVPKPEPPGLLDSFFFWHHTLPSSTRGLAASLCFAAAALLVAAGIRWRQAFLRTAALLPALAWLGLLGSLAIEASHADEQAAVVTANEVVARAADSALAPSALAEPLPGGTEIEIVGRRSPWLRVRLANGRDAWLPESSVSPVVEGLLRKAG